MEAVVALCKVRYQALLFDELEICVLDSKALQLL